jgi:hypothetical protein
MGTGTDLLVTSATDLRRWALSPEAATPVSQMRVVVEEWRAPSPGWSGRLGPLPHLVGHELLLPSSGRGRAEVFVAVGEPVPAELAVLSVLQALDPAASMPVPTSPDIMVNGWRPGWLPPARALRRRTVGSASPGAGRHDVILVTHDGLEHDDPTGTDSDQPPQLRAGASGIHSDPPLVLVDAASANPSGRRRYDARLPTGVVRLARHESTARWWVESGAGDQPPIVAGVVGEPLDARQREVLANLSSISCALPIDVPSDLCAATIAQLAMTGVLLHTPDLDVGIGKLLGPELAELLSRPVSSRDGLDREIASVRQRRAALRWHATGIGLIAGSQAALPGLSHLPGVTALLLTRRTDRLGPVLADLARQTYPELEVVVGFHGVEPTRGDLEAVSRYEGHIEMVSVPANVTFGGALGEVTRRARGTLLTKVDDDDRYGAEHVWDLVLAKHYSGATLVGKGAEFVYLARRDRTIRRRMDSEVYDGYVAGGTMLVARGDLEAVGGWRPVKRSVDRTLIDRLLAAGGLVYRTHGFGYIYTRHDEGHTWEVSLEQFERDAMRTWAGLPPYGEFETA